MTYKSLIIKRIGLRKGFLALLLITLISCENNKNLKQTEGDQESVETQIETSVLSITSQDANSIKNLLEENSILKTSFDQQKSRADQALASDIEVPQPKDPGGGYTHEKHKRNYGDMYAAGIAYKILGEEKYAQFVTDMLLAYSKMYPNLPLHPKRKENHPSGKLFWQGLNESVWLVNTIQAYNLVKEAISSENKEEIETNVFRKVAEFISVDSNDTFDRIHNHGTWAVAGVGMTGYVLKDQDMVDRALYGSNKDKTTGFLKQINELFSPDGYYSEGPYYQRYAMMPFMVFAQAIEFNQPELKIFEYRNQLLGKAVNTVLQLTDANGAFLPFNDALKEKNYLTGELVFATNIAYAYYKNPELLPVIYEQQQVSISSAGLETAKALKNYSYKAYTKKPMIIGDGKDGDQGGLALLRMPNGKEGKQFTSIFKFASQGMGHGHFDRLSIMLYDGKQEILQDYGAARFLNVESKQGGRYLPENKTWAKQTIAHNTVTVDQQSQFGANVKKSEKISPELLFADLERKDIQIVSATENNAYENLNMRRTVAMIQAEGNKPPFIIDIYNILADKVHQYDQNFMYQGHLMETSFDYTKNATLSPLGTKNGYQHLWKLAEGQSDQNVATFTWLNENSFYSISSKVNPKSKLVFALLGANDPEFNLRDDTAYMIRQSGKKNHTFINVIEPHGSFDPKLEAVQNPHSSVSDIQLLYDDEENTVIKVIFKNNKTYTLMVSSNKDDQKNHEIIIGTEKYQWTGNYKLKIN